MMDRTNVGISPLISTPQYISPEMTTTSAYTTGIEGFDQGVTYQDPNAGFIPDTGMGMQTTYTDPMVNYSTPEVQTIPDLQNYMVPGTDGVTGAMLPSATSPEYVSENPLAQNFGSYVTGVTTQPVATEYVAPQPMEYQTTTLGTTVATPTPVPVPAPMPAPPQNPPIGPIMDEDFQRGRPIYDEFKEDRYRGFRFGSG